MEAKQHTYISKIVFSPDFSATDLAHQETTLFL